MSFFFHLDDVYNFLRINLKKNNVYLDQSINNVFHKIFMTIFIILLESQLEANHVRYSNKDISDAYPNDKFVIHTFFLFSTNNLAKPKNVNEKFEKIS